MSEAVTVTGTPHLALNIGGTTVQANYVSGSGSSALVFNYTILAGQTDTNGISIAANALSLNSGTIKDLAGHAATLTAAAVADNASYAVDASAPNAPTGLRTFRLQRLWSAATDNTGGSGVDHYLYQVHSRTVSTSEWNVHLHHWSTPAPGAAQRNAELDHCSWSPSTSRGTSAVPRSHSSPPPPAPRAKPSTSR